MSGYNIPIWLNQIGIITTYNNYKKEHFNLSYELFRNADWTDIGRFSDVNEAVEYFYSIIQGVASWEGHSLIGGREHQW